MFVISHVFSCLGQAPETVPMLSMAYALELKRMLVNIGNGESQSMDAYLRNIKTIADNLTSVNASVSQSDLVHYNLMGLGREYETLVTTLTHVPMDLTFDDLCPRLLLQQRFCLPDANDWGILTSCPHHPATFLFELRLSLS